MNLALGLIETKGLVGALEAADAMAKAASIKIIGKEKVTAGLIVIKIEGEVAAVKSAVDAGSVAAQRVGELVSAHVIPRPAEQIDSILIKNTSPSSKTEKVEQKKTKIENIINVKETVVEKPVVKTVTKKTKDPVIKKQAKSQTKKVSKRTVVKSTSGKKTSTKTQTLNELETLNVHALRKLARSSSNFPIKGRDISKANRGKLLDYFKKMK